MSDRYDDRPGKLSVATAFGYFKGETGLAAGLGYAATTSLRFNAAATAAPHTRDYAATVGASWTLN